MFGLSEISGKLSRILDKIDSFNVIKVEVCNGSKNV
jgi:hypothetical protein